MPATLDPNALIARLSGQPPQGTTATPAAPAVGATPTPAGPASEGGKTSPTPSEQATSAAEPTTAGDAPPVVYRVKFGDQERALTPEQIVSTFERYRDLNHDHAQVKPAMSFVRELMNRSGKSAQEIAQFLATAAQQFNPGTAVSPPANAAPATNTDDELTKWEQENAASLPPGYRDMHKAIRQVGQGQDQLMQMLRNVLNQSAGVVDAAKTAQNDARTQRLAAIKNTISNNLNAAQQKLQLDGQHAKDFMTFAAERGFTLEDFSDPDLTMRVATDFKANLGTPELERLKAVAARRQAYTGTMGSAPGAGAATGGDPAPKTTLDRLMQRAGR